MIVDVYINSSKLGTLWDVDSGYGSSNWLHSTGNQSGELRPSDYCTIPSNLSYTVLYSNLT
jgi:hypothetical protein